MSGIKYSTIANYWFTSVVSIVCCPLKTFSAGKTLKRQISYLVTLQDAKSHFHYPSDLNFPKFKVHI